MIKHYIAEFYHKNENRSYVVHFDSEFRSNAKKTIDIAWNSLYNEFGFTKLDCILNFISRLS